MPAVAATAPARAYEPDPLSTTSTMPMPTIAMGSRAIAPVDAEGRGPGLPEEGNVGVRHRANLRSAHGLLRWGRIDL